MFHINQKAQDVEPIRNGKTVIYRTLSKEATGAYIPTGFTRNTVKGKEDVEFYVSRGIQKTKMGKEIPLREPDYIAVDGVLILPATEPALIAYLDEWIKAKGADAMIEKEDLAEAALNSVNRERDLLKAKMLILDDEKKLDTEALKEVAKSYGYRNEFAEPQEVQNFLLGKINDKPTEFLFRVGNVETKLKAMLNDAVTAQLITFQNNSWYLLDDKGQRGERLTNVRVGANSIDVLSSWLCNEENVNYKEMLTEHVKIWRKSSGFSEVPEEEKRKAGRPAKTTA